LVALRRAKKDGDTPFIGELKAVGRLSCAPRRGKAVWVAAWAVGAATTCAGAQAKCGGAVVGWAAARSVCPACGCGTRGDGGLGVDVGAELWDLRTQRCTGGCARSAGGAGWRGHAHDVASGRERAALLTRRNRLGPVQPRFTPNFSTEVVQAVNSKVVDLLFLYNFYEGCRVFFSTSCAQMACQHGSFLGASEQYPRTLTCIFDHFALQTSNATQHESCVPRQNTQLLYWENLKCLGEIWGTRQKFRATLVGQRLSVMLVIRGCR
jgi:hypothetical protein